MENEPTSTRKKWYKWRFIGLAIIAFALFIKLFVMKDSSDEANAPVVLIDLDKVAFKSEREVEAVLGKGTLKSYWRDDKAGCEKCPTMLYRDGKVEIIYINEIADRILISNLSEFSFNGRIILELLNLKREMKPTFGNADVIRWDSYEKYTEIAAFAKKDKLDYILVKSKSK